MDLTTAVITSTTLPPPPATREITLLMSLSYLIFAIAGLIPNLILLFMIFKPMAPTSPQKTSHSPSSQQSFFMIAAMITMADVGALSVQIVIAFPITFFTRNIYVGGWEWVFWVFTIMDTVCYNGVLYFTFLMALNRFTVFMFPSVNDRIFNGISMVVTIILVWLLVAFETVSGNLLGCTKKFSEKGFYLFPFCAIKDPLPMLWLDIMKQQSRVLPVIMFALYSIIFLFLKTKLSKIRKMETFGNTSKQRAEVRLLIQAAIICVIMEIQTLAFGFLPKVGFGYGYYYSNLAQNLITIMSNSINPYVYLVFNRQLRTQLWSMIRWKPVTPPTMSSKISIVVTTTKF